MHKSSMLRMKCFIDNYVIGGKGKKVLDIGSYNIGGCYKTLFSDVEIEYVGLDIEKGPNVDIVMDTPYSWDSLENESFDYIISGQAFEHIEYPWLTMKEIYKKLKIDGIICVIAPNGLFEHKYPLDCYRFYEDGMHALAEWAGFNVLEVSVAGIPNSKVSIDWDDIWNDVCLVACKSKRCLRKFSGKRMFSIKRRFDPISNLKLQYNFLTKWKYDSNRIDDMIISFITRGNYEEVYIIGNENIGTILESLFILREISYKIVETEKIYVTENCQGENGKIKNLYKNNEKNVLCIFTILDVGRKWIEEIDKHVFSNVIYIDDLVKSEEEIETVNQMKEYFQECPEIFIYGAGFNGKYIMEILKKYMFRISGFVVSDDHYTKNRGNNIYKISEISKNFGIIISPYEDEEIKKNLKNLDFEKCYDGKKLINFQYDLCKY